MSGEYFLSSHGVALLAHRGLVLPGSKVVENTAAAFDAALRFGASHIETDVQVTKDQIAVLLHDPDLSRLTGENRKVDQVSYQELRAICSNVGFEPLSLASALNEFPAAKFNLDIKAWRAVSPAAAQIETAKAHGRVLVSSFSDARRVASLQALSQSVATSGGAGTALKARVAATLRARRMLAASLVGVEALQLPLSMHGVRFATRRFISVLRDMGIHVHFWTVNSPELAQHLLDLGATGLVSDRVDLIAPLLGNT